MVYTKLKEHQRDIVKFCVDLQYFGIFADYGTGKTLCALKIADILGARKVLIVSTITSLKSTWVNEIRKHTDFRQVLLLGTKSQRLNQLKIGLRISYVDGGAYHSSNKCPTFFLINYDGVKTIANNIIASGFDIVFIDESTKIKSIKTVRTKSIIYLSNHIPIRGILTGFPVTESLEDLYSQIKFLNSTDCVLGVSWHHYMNTYFTKLGFKYIIRRGSSAKIIDKIKPFCIRVAEDAIDLPRKIYKTLVVEPTTQQLRYLKQLNDEFRLTVNDVNIDSKYIFTLIVKSLQICNGFIQDNPKDEDGNYLPKEQSIQFIPCNKDLVLLDLLEDIGKGHKILIWSSSTTQILRTQISLKKHGYRVNILIGSTDDVDGTINNFQYGNTDILIASLKKAAESVNIPVVKYAVYISNVYSFDIRDNSEGRIRRLTSVNEHVVYTDIYIKDTIEEDVLNCLKNKKALVESVKKRFTELR